VEELDMYILARVAIVSAVAILALAFAWVTSGPSQDGVAATLPTPAPTSALTPAPTTMPTASPTVLPHAGTLLPGRYRFAESPLSVEVPAGWHAEGGFVITKDYGTRDAEFGAAFTVWEITGTYVDPCTDHTLVAPAPGSGVDELAADLASMPGTVADQPTNVTIDGYRGKAVEVTVATDIASCGIDSFWLWASPDGDHRYVNGSNEVNRIYIVDVDGERLTFAARITPATTTADRAELEAMIASIRIEP
jgi:hypothetical protein